MEPIRLVIETILLPSPRATVSTKASDDAHRSQGVDLQHVAPGVIVEPAERQSAGSKDAGIVDKKINRFVFQLPRQCGDLLRMGDVELVDVDLWREMQKLVRVLRFATAGMNAPSVGQILADEFEPNAPICAGYEIRFPCSTLRSSFHVKSEGPARLSRPIRRRNKTSISAMGGPSPCSGAIISSAASSVLAIQLSSAPIRGPVPISTPTFFRANSSESACSVAGGRSTTASTSANRTGGNVCLRHIQSSQASVRSAYRYFLTAISFLSRM